MKRVGAVIDTLDDILASIESEEREEAANVEAFLQWCKDNTKAMDKALAQAKADFEEASTADKEVSATVAGLEHTLGLTDTSIEETQDMIDQAQTRRDEENAKYTEDMQMNSQSLNQINQAIAIVGKVHGEGGLLQQDLEQNGQRQELQLYRPGESRLVLGVMKGLKARLEKTRDEMKASEEQKEEDHQNLMNTKKQQLASLQEESVEKKQMKREVQLELVESKAHAKGATKTIKSTTKLLDQTTSECNEKNQSWTVRCADRDKEKATIRQAIDVLVSLQNAEATEIEADGSEEEQQDDGGAEEDAGAGGGDPGGSASFLQRRQRRQGIQSRSSVLSLLQTMQASHHRHRGALSGDLAGRAFSMLAAAASERGEENFDAAKKVVKDLIAVLEEQAKEEADKKKYCEAELAKKNTDATEVNDTLQSLEAAIDYKSTEVESLENKIGTTQDSVTTMKENLERAQSMRADEKKAYEASTKDRTLAIKVLKQAKEVLRQFYATEDNTAAMAQLHVKEDPSCNCNASFQPVCGVDGVTYASSCKAECKSVEVAKEGECEKTTLTGHLERPDTFSGSSRKETASQGVLDLMDMIAESIRKEQDTADSTERQAAAEFSTLQQETRENEDHMWQEITGWVKLKAKLAVRLNIDRETKTQRTENLESIDGQISTLHDECDDLLEHFDQRVKARDFELSQLKDVTDILAGSSVAGRTGLFDQQASTMSKREMALLKGLTTDES